MAIIFENIDTHETVGIDREVGGKFYHAKLSALMNSSNMSPNADRGQDYGWRLVPEQQALIEQWESDPDMIDKVSNFTKVMTDELTHAEFLAYLLYQQELGRAPEKAQQLDRRQHQLEYEARVEALKSQTKPEAMAAFEPKVNRGEETLENFMNGDLTGDAGGDKVVDEASEVDLADLAKVEIPSDVQIESTPPQNKTEDVVEESTPSKAKTTKK